jgi:hypothetical protein
MISPSPQEPGTPCGVDGHGLTIVAPSIAARKGVDSEKEPGSARVCAAGLGMAAPCRHSSISGAVWNGLDGARKSEGLMPRDPSGEAQTLQWTIAALNSIEMVAVPWWFLEVTGAKDNPLTGWLESRLGHMERILKEREWLVADRFTAADLLMADVLRVPKVRSFGDRPATEAYVTRITARPSFKKAHADQMAHFAAADKMRS